MRRRTSARRGEGYGCHPVLGAENIIKHHPYTVDVLITDLYKATSALVQEFMRKQQSSIAEIGEVRVDAEFPGVSEGSNLLRFSRQIFIFSVSDLALSHKRLEV